MPPNLLLITTHDTGRHLGCYGVETVRTPNLDALAEGGCRFTNYFATSALCSPSRGAMMTGRYPQTNGMMGLCHGPWAWSLNPGEKHLSHLMHQAGYYTVLLGHQHETTDVDEQLCFDEHGFHRDPKTHHHLPCDQVSEAVREFLMGPAAGKAPFYLQVGFFETHRTFDFGGAEPDDTEGVWIPPYIEDNEAARQQFAAFQGNIHKMDRAVGRILNALEEAGLREDTLVVYSVDHGIPFPRAKNTLFDPGTEIPLIMRLPGLTEPGSACDALLGNVDLVPTLLDVLGVPTPPNLDGNSFAAALSGGPAPGRRCVFAELVGKALRSVRTRRYKLIRSFRAQRLPAYPVNLEQQESGANWPRVLLFDLEEDPAELNNLADDPEYAEVRRELDTRLREWLERVGDAILDGPVPSPYYLEAIHPYREGES